MLTRVICLKQEKYLWLHHVPVVTSIAYASIDASIEFNNITLLDFNWKIHGFNMAIIDANISKSHIIIERKDKTIGNISIYESSFRHTNISSGYQISVFECNINGGSMLEKTLFDIKGCSLNIINSSFSNLAKGNSGPAIVNGMESTVTLHNTKIYVNNALNGLIQIQNGSQLHIESSTFESNVYSMITSSIILVKSNSSAFINNCNFNNNVGLYGSCVYCYQNTTINVINTKFKANTALKGGVIFYQNQYDQVMYDHFSNNQLLKTTTSNTNEMLLVLVNMDHCELVDNYGMLDGGALYIEGSSFHLFITRCNILNNMTNRYVGAMYIRGMYDLTILISIDEWYLYHTVLERV